jgi:cytochrome c-type biogenesis protein
VVSGAYKEQAPQWYPHAALCSNTTEAPHRTIMNGPALLVAFGGGLISFLSPCTLPLLPGYLSYISGLGAEEVQSGENTGLLVGTSVLFVLGFSLVFVALGATASYVGSLVASYHSVLNRAAGVFIIVMALIMVGMVRFPLFYQEKRFHLSRDFGMWSALPLGMAFAFGWTPCIGPVLTSIMAIASQQGTAERGAFLLFVYALGLGAPFLLVSLFTERAFRSLRWFKHHYSALNLTGGALLLVMGVFLVLGQWTQFMAPFMNWYNQLNLPS